MIGKCAAQLDRPKLDDFCETRRLQLQQETRDKINATLALIERNANAHSPPEWTTRPYGVPSMGEAFHVWSYILDQVSNPFEVRELWQVSGLFQTILRRKYVETQFPQIVQLILEKRPEYLVPDNLPLRRKKCVFFGMRLLSKQCKLSADATTDRTTDFNSTLIQIRSLEDLQTATNWLMSKPSSATIGPKAIILSVEREDAIQERIQEGITAILEMCSKGLLGFFYQAYLASPQLVYANLREWAKLMPNLRVLSVEIKAAEEAPVAPPALEEIEPFPPISSLLIFKEDKQVLPIQYVQRILETNPAGIRELALMEEEVVREHSPEFLRTFVNLTKLRICPYPQLLEQLTLPWKLNSIVLEHRDVTFEAENGYFKTVTSSSRVFLFLKQFKDTLEHLQIMIDITDCSGYLELPNLKTFMWRHHESFASLNFLLYCAKLEQVRVLLNKSFMRNMTPREGYNRLLESSFLEKSIWEVFPNLKVFTICESNIFQSTLLEERRVAA